MHVSIKCPHMVGCEVTFPTSKLPSPFTSPVPPRCLGTVFPPSRKFASSCPATCEIHPTPTHSPHQTEFPLTEAATFRPSAACCFAIRALLSAHTPAEVPMAKPNGLTKGLPSARLGNGKATTPSRKYGAPGARSGRSRLFNTITRWVRGSGLSCAGRSRWLMIPLAEY